MAPPPPTRNVALAILRYFPHGGLQRIALEVAEELRDRGHRVRLFTQTWSGPSPAGMDRGSGGELQIVTCPTSARTNHSSAEQFARSLRNALAADPADVLLGFDRLPGLDLYFAGDPCYSARLRRDRGPLARWTPRARAFLALERSVFGAHSRARILLMNAREESLIRAEYSTPGARFRVLPPGYSPSRRCPPDARKRRERVRKELGIEGAFCALALGSDFHRKGFDRAVRAIGHAQRAATRDVRLLLVGAGSPTRLQALARREGVADELRCLGPRDDVVDLLQAADLLIHPARSEPAGMVLLEALSAGLSVITTEASGYATHVEASGAGIVLAEPFRQANLNDALARLMNESTGDRAQRALSHAATLDPFAMRDAVVAEVESFTP